MRIGGNVNNQAAVLFQNHAFEAAAGLCGYLMLTLLLAFVGRLAILFPLSSFAFAGIGYYYVGDMQRKRSMLQILLEEIKTDLPNNEWTFGQCLAVAAWVPSTMQLLVTLKASGP